MNDLYLVGNRNAIFRHLCLDSSTVFFIQHANIVSSSLYKTGTKDYFEEYL